MRNLCLLWAVLRRHCHWHPNEIHTKDTLLSLIICTDFTKPMLRIDGMVRTKQLEKGEERIAGLL